MAEIQPSEDFLTFSEVSHEPDYYDDWLFNSTRRYKHVSMYETEKSISSAQWFGENKQSKYTIIFPLLSSVPSRTFLILINIHTSS